MDKQNLNKRSRLQRYWIVYERQWETEKDF